MRCNGQSPCNRCERKPSECVYRLRTRVRKSGAQRAAAGVSKPVSTSPNVPQRPEQQPTTPRPFTTDGAAISPAGFRGPLPDGDGPKSDSAIYQGIAAAHEDLESTENPRLFYGPACKYTHTSVHPVLFKSQYLPRIDPVNSTIRLPPASPPGYSLVHWPPWPQPGA